MFNYPVEKNIIRFYKYKFRNEIQGEITVEAYNKKQAREYLREYIIQGITNHRFISFLRGVDMRYFISELGISETLSLPIYGETTKKIDEVEHVWVGDGWIPLWEYQKQNDI